jgi:hypothetical protein
MSTSWSPNSLGELGDLNQYRLFGQRPLRWSLGDCEYHCELEVEGARQSVPRASAVLVGSSVAPPRLLW